MHHLYLASSSPRRREILEKRNIQFEPLPLKVSEIPSENLNPLDQIRKISMDKLLAAQFEIKRQNTPKRPYVLLCADTEVIFQGKLMGKPADQGDAILTLGRLSGLRHEVTTVVTLFESSQNETFEIVTTTHVEFAQLSPKDIHDYVRTGDPMDKAGSYGIQNVPKHFIIALQGSFENVVGLPGDELIAFFQKRQWVFPTLSAQNGHLT